MIATRVFILALFTITACAPRGEISYDPSAASVGQVHTVHVGTTRAVDPETGSFGGDRRAETSFARYDVSIPPAHLPGTISWPGRGKAPNPETDFVTTDRQLYTGAAPFRSSLSRALAQNGGEAVVFVHGFNNTFSEGLYRIVQLSHDLDVPGAMVHYSWPSRGNPLRYAYDRDSALFARDGLESLLKEVEAAGAKRILIVAHSLGSALVMEALRQNAISGDGRLRQRISGVVLISPDIDVDVFHEQAQRMGRLPQPFLIFTSERDRALQLSARLTGQNNRLGNLASAEPVADLEVTLLDVGAFSTGDGHFNVGRSSALIRLLSRLSDVNAAYGRDQTGRTGLLPGAVLTVQDATQIILTPVTEIATSAVR